MNGTLKINEMFLSVQGESTHVGRVCSFVRLTGCPLRCTYCDTEYAFFEGQSQTFDEVFDRLSSFGSKLVEVTGGEPLAQRNAIPFMNELVARGYEVLLETSGAYPIFDVPKEVAVIMDIKTPGSKEGGKMVWDNIGSLKPGLDELKFVVCSREDFDFAVDVSKKYKLFDRVTVLVSPSHGVVPPKDLAEWVIESRLPFRFQVQMHKFIWGAETRGV